MGSWVSAKGVHGALALILLAGVLLAVALGALAGGAGGSFEVRRGSDTLETIEGDDDDASAEAGSVEEPEPLVVDVSGAVANPGVYDMEPNSRVDDALGRAGGLSEDADVSGINRASKLVDGQKIYVPRLGESSPPQSGPSVTSAGSGLVSINQAGVEELDTLDGIGPSTAAAIVRDREENGPFKTLEDLMRVSGIGEKRFQNIKDSICL
ncbi:MAG: helix-hairpin-helix domain-containing protein [Collinsella sp.]|nr:helix-hairpin-helix domain-containing protein [Collinsella sp.]